MSDQTSSSNGNQQAQSLTSNDKVNIAIPRRLINFIANASTQIGVYVMISAFSPVLSAVQPKPIGGCSSSPPSQILLK